MKETPRILITGTGRAGTTLLMHILTRLGLDTGFDPAKVEDSIFKEARAGLETLPEPLSPTIVKACEMSGQIDKYVRDGYRFQHVIVPIREIEHSVKSRAAIGDENSGKPGALIVADPDQAAKYRADIYQLCHDCALHSIPITFMHFPRFAEDFGYFFDKICEPWYIRGNITYTAVRAAFREVVDLSLINTY